VKDRVGDRDRDRRTALDAKPRQSKREEDIDRDWRTLHDMAKHNVQRE
jgi:hypothetical protein